MQCSEQGECRVRVENIKVPIQDYFQKEARQKMVGLYTQTHTRFYHIAKNWDRL